MVSSLVGASAAGVLLLSASFLLLTHVTPPRTAKRTTAMRSPFGFIDLSPLPPGDHAEPDNGQREDDHAQPEHEVEFLRGQGEGAVFGGFRTDADQVFVGAEPVDRVHEQIAAA